MVAAKNIGPGYEYRARKGTVSQEDAELIGKSLEQIALRNRVNDVRTLTAAVVLQEVLKDRQHPLRKFYEWDTKKAAHKHWLEQTRQLIGYVQFVTIGDVNVPEVQRPLYVSAEVEIESDGKTSRFRPHVDMRDLEKTDAPFMSAVALHVRRIADATAGLERLTLRRDGPPGVADLKAKVRKALDAYYAKIDG